MSQVRQQNTDQHNYIHQPASVSPSRFPSVPHYPTSVPSSLRSDLIPRDYLNPRSDGPPFSSGPAPSIALRKPTLPSPLQTSSQPRSLSPVDSSSSRSPQPPKNSAYPAPFDDRTTLSRIAHAAFPAPPFGTSEISTNTTGKRQLDGLVQNDSDMSERTVDNASRQTSYTAGSNQSATSSPVSPVNSSKPMSRERQGQRTMPRTSSIDSAISSLSSTSQSHKSPFDAGALSQSDIGNLIATAGSPEAVIIHLLKEKHHAASQNNQLWRLVDKQRTLILGLNKDLERALKEKDRYKNKVKELQSAAPPLPSLQEHAQHYGTLEVDSALEYETTAPRRVPNQSIRLDVQDSKEQNLANDLAHAAQLDDFPSPSTLSLQNRAEPSLSTDSDNTQASSIRKDSDGPIGQQSNQPLLYSRQDLSTASPTSMASSSSPTNDKVPAGDKQQRIPHPIRKPPPAPLNLESRSGVSAGNAHVYDSESEYEDILEVDELPVERGRRKTRDDDDRDRETTLARESGLSSSAGHDNALSVGTSGDPQATSSGSIRPSPQDDFLASTLSPRITQGLSTNSISKAPKSPGLPLSPRPEDRPLGSPLPRMPRDMQHTLSSVPMSSGNNISGLALSPRMGAYQPPFSGGPSSSTVANPTSHKLGPIDAAIRPIPSIDATVKIDSPHSPGSRSHAIYQGLVSEEYPGFLLPPNALPLIQVKVSSSRLRPSRNSYMASKPLEEEPVFTLGIFSRSDNKELWRVEKVIAALPHLDHQLRQSSAFPMRLPDRSIFSGHSPAKVDARRAALNSYFEAALDTPMDEKTALVICQFLTSDAIEPRDDETSLLKGNSQSSAEILRGPDGKPRKEGYLTKRGKNFGGWKARYFVLHGPELKYFESPGGAHLGTIKIHNSQIGKQSQATSDSPSRAEDDTENQYRHAFLILEPKRKDTSALVRHVLCAESDEERDSWVEALLEYVESSSETEGPGYGLIKAQTQAPAKPSSAMNPKNKSYANGAKKPTKGSDGSGLDAPDTVQGFSYDDAVPADPPVFGPPLDQQGPRSPMFASNPYIDIFDTAQGFNSLSEQAQAPSKVISGPTNGAIIQDVGAWGNKAATSTKEKKRSIWGFRTRSSYDLASQLQANNDSPTTPAYNSTFGEKRDFVRPVFGIPLAEAVQFCTPEGVDADLPAVVYRCIEYLRAKGAESEEGIFRLSGSNVVVKALKERFNTEGDVDFLADDQYYDVHAVASLFKQYLRELPTSVLTRELHIEFLRVLELNEKQQKIVAFNSLVHLLPKANLALLRALAQFLIIIVSNSDVNKMTVRNVGIVFAPTLNIPAPVFSMFLTDFEQIFDEIPRSKANNMDTTVDHPHGSQDIRSPRKQMFSDIPTTPADTQATFRRHGDRDDLGAHHDTGFIAMQPNYDQPPSDRFNSGPAMLAPHPDNSRSAKAKRRESSLLFMEVNHQTPPGTTLPDDRG